MGLAARRVTFAYHTCTIYRPNFANGIERGVKKCRHCSSSSSSGSMKKFINCHFFTTMKLRNYLRSGLGCGDRKPICKIRLWACCRREWKKYHARFGRCSYSSSLGRRSSPRVCDEGWPFFHIFERSGFFRIRPCYHAYLHWFTLKMGRILSTVARAMTCARDSWHYCRGCRHYSWRAWWCMQLANSISATLNEKYELQIGGSSSHISWMRNRIVSIFS